MGAVVGCPHSHGHLIRVESDGTCVRVKNLCDDPIVYSAHISAGFQSESMRSTTFPVRIEGRQEHCVKATGKEDYDNCCSHELNGNADKPCAYHFSATKVRRPDALPEVHRMGYKKDQYFFGLRCGEHIVIQRWREAATFENTNYFKLYKGDKFFDNDGQLYDAVRGYLISVYTTKYQMQEKVAEEKAKDFRRSLEMHCNVPTSDEKKHEGAELTLRRVTSTQRGKMARMWTSAARCPVSDREWCGLLNEGIRDDISQMLEEGKGELVLIAATMNGFCVERGPADGRDIPWPMTEQAEGTYFVLEDLPVHASQAYTSPELARLQAGTLVEVVEVVHVPDEKGTVRARIAEPAGWISKCMADNTLEFVTKVGTLWRGGRLPLQHFEWYKNMAARQGLYRVNMFLATSSIMAKADLFMRTLSQPRTEKMVLYKFRLFKQGGVICDHVNCLENITAVKEEHEFLFPPYSAFRCIRAVDQGDKYVIEADVMQDNRSENDGGTLPCNLPLSPWA